MRAARPRNTASELTYFSSVNPYTREIIARYSYFTPAETEEALTRVTEDAAVLAGCAASERADILTALADMLHTRREKMAMLIVHETGKLYKEATAEVDKSVDCLRYYADNAEAILYRPDTTLADGGRIQSVYRPIGNVLAIMPWNFPVWQVIRCLAPNFLLGNGVVLKHASNVQGCAKALEEWVTETLNLQALAVLRVPSDAIKTIINDPRIAAVTLTGGEYAGAATAEAAGRVLKKTVLELGGSDPYLVLGDADIEYAARICMQSRLINAGQSCISAKRFMVVSSIYDDFMDAAKACAADYVPGNPEEEHTTFAPLAKHAMCADMRDIVADAVASGASIIHGGAYDAESPFYPVTLLGDVNETMGVFHDEIFGPVASVVRADSERHAIFLANFTDFGLGGAVFSCDETRALAVAERIHTGGVAINGMYRSLPQAPFGGVGKSGYGRELGGAAGVAEFANLKTYLLP